MDASYPISVRQVAALLHTSFRRHLAMTPFCFASPSPPSGWTGDFHPQTIEHAGHTTKSLRDRSPLRWCRCFLALRSRIERFEIPRPTCEGHICITMDLNDEHRATGDAVIILMSRSKQLQLDKIVVYQTPEGRFAL